MRTSPFTQEVIIRIPQLRVSTDFASLHYIALIIQPHKQLHIQGYTNMNVLLFLPISLVVFVLHLRHRLSLHLLIIQLKH